MRSWLLALALVLSVACKRNDEAPAAAPSDRPAPIPATELKRGEDACKALIEKACACTAPAAKDVCTSSKTLPESIELALDVVSNPDSARRDVLQAQDAIRKTMKNCIEQVAKLPTIGC
ncbi:MAG: hypothetical protein AB7P03_08805 [Kofleriaceae bacterium]